MKTYGFHPHFFNLVQYYLYALWDIRNCGTSSWCMSICIASLWSVLIKLLYTSSMLLFSVMSWLLHGFCFITSIVAYLANVHDSLT